MSKGCFTHGTRLADAGLSLSVNPGDIYVGTLCGGALDPKDGSQLCVEGGFAVTLFAKSCTETTMPVLVTGNTTHGAALNEDGAVPKLSVL